MSINRSVFCLLLCSGLWAQDAELSGLVKDPSDSVVPGAQLKIRNVDTGYERSTLSNEAGAYDFSALRPAAYEVEVSKPGFQTLLRSNLKLEVAQRARLDFTLKVGTTAQNLEVTAVPPAIDLASPMVMGVEDAATTRGLPLNGRDWTQLATLQAGVATVRTQQALASTRGNRGYGTQVTIAGARPQQNTYRLDGIIQNDYANSTPGSVLGLALGTESVEEFSILTSGYSAEYGMTSGGVITAITRSGSNALHGNAYEFLRNDQLDARNFFDVQKPPFRRNQFGASAGGPLWKNHTFIFGNYEGLRQSLTTTSVATTPSLNARNGQLASGTVTVSPLVKPFLPLWPLPNAGLLGNGDTGRYLLPIGDLSNEDFVTFRVDHTISAHDSLSGTYLYDNATDNSPDALNVVNILNRTRRQTGSLQENHVFGTRLLNTARVGFNRDVAHTLDTTPGANPLGTDLSLGSVPGKTAPFINVTGLAGFSGGVGAQPAADYAFTTYQAYDDASLQKGIHTLKFGFSLIRFQQNYLADARSTGTFSFNSLSDFLTNKPSAYQADIATIPAGLSVPAFPPAPRGLRQTAVGLYFEDDIRLRSNLTVNLGVRYELATVPTEEHNRLGSLPSLTSTTVHVGAPFFSNPTTKNFDPRIGLVWDPFRDGKTAVRASFGINDDLPLLYHYALIENYALPYFPYSTLNVPLPQGAFPTGAYQLLLSNLRLRAAYIDPNPPRSYVMKWNFNIQRSITSGLVAEAAYTGTRGAHLPFNADDTNLVLPAATAAGYVWPSPAGSGTVLNPAFSGIRTLLYSNNSFYDGLTLRLQKRFSHGLQLQGSYTWSKSIDEGSSEIAGNAYANSIAGLMWFDPKINRALADFHIGRSVVISGLWDVPGARAWAGPAKGILGGWQLAGIFHAADGLPFTPLISGDALGLKDGATYDIPDRTPCSSLTNARNPNQYINLGCYQFPSPATRLGNAGRNSIIGPGFANLDFSLLKNIPVARIAEDFKAQFRAEFFNVFNRANFGLPSNSLFTAAGAVVGNAGLITSTATASRQIQFGLKLIW
jgi:hypothetical protein